MASVAAAVVVVAMVVVAVVVVVVVVVAAAVRREEVAAPARGNAALCERERPEHEELEAAHVYGCPRAPRKFC